MFHKSFHYTSRFTITVGHPVFTEHVIYQVIFFSIMTMIWEITLNVYIERDYSYSLISVTQRQRFDFTDTQIY